MNVSKIVGLVALVVGSFGASSAMAADAVKAACQNALEGKCFHGATLVLDEITTNVQAEGFCTSNPNFCAVSECVTRVEIIRGLALGGNGNPCL